MKRLAFAVGLAVVAVVPLFGQPFSTPITQAIALVTSGTTTFSIVGVDASGYINWGASRSSAGYGIRDNAGVIEVKNSGGSWSPVSSSGGAPSTATYITQTPNSSLSAEQPLSALASALLLNTTTTGVLTAYTGTSCTNQFVRSLSALGVATCASVSLTADVTGTLPVTTGGTGLATVTQGDLLYASASNTLSALAKNTTATRYLANTGTSNNPAWAQIALATGVSGTLPIANGGTGLTTGTSGGVLYFSGATTLASSAALTANQLMIGGGAGVAPSTIACGTATTVVHGGTPPTCGAVNLATDVTGSIGVAAGGTGIASYTIGDLIYASGTTALSKLADVSAGSFLRSGGVGVAPAWSTTKWPNAATTGDVVYASGANTYANLADVTAGSYLRSGGTSTAPVWSTATLPNSATTGDLLYASAANTYTNLTAVATGRVLASMGVGTAPAWLTNVTATSFGSTGTIASAGFLRLANTDAIEARNTGDTNNIALLSSNSSDQIVLGGANGTALTYTDGTRNLFWRVAAAPTISSGFGTTPSIAGNPSAFKVTVGSGGDTSGVVLFNVTWSTAPVCMANNQTTAQLVRTLPTTTQVTISGTLAAADVISVLCVGY